MVKIGSWHWSNWVFYSIRALWFVLNVTTLMFRYGDVTHPWIVRGMLTVCFLVPLLFWRPTYTNTTRYLLAETVFTGGMSFYLYVVLGLQTTFLVMPSILVGFFTDRRNAWWVAPLFILFFPLSGTLFGDVPFRDSVVGVLDGALGIMIGYSFNRIRRTHERVAELLGENQLQYQLIQEQNQTVLQYSQQVEQLTLLEERNRMARELHDTVGHTLTSVIMGMDAVMYLIDLGPEKAKERLEVLRDVTRNGLEEVQRNIHHLEAPGEVKSLGRALSGIAGEFAVHTATQIRMEKEGEEYPLPKQVRLTLIRCLQESLTNAKRHGQATSVLILLRFEEEQVSLRIEDDGVGMSDLQFGFGLQAMRGRVAAHQGMLDVKSAPGEGAVVHCTIPLRGAREDEGDTLAAGR
jgi:signal transduction histidine kinase